MILNIYKPKTWTSYDVVAKIRGILRNYTGNKKIKVGHGGTLDPLAEGVLLILTHENTKDSMEIMKMPKEYVGEIVFGVYSPTYDMEGPLEFVNLPENLNNEKIKQNILEIIPEFIGNIEQKVPIYSAAKVDGKPLYKTARKSKNKDEIETPVKKVMVYEIKILESYVSEIQGKKLPTLKVQIACGAGTYIRALAHDFGEKIGTKAILKSLTRTEIGKYRIENSTRIEEIEDKLLFLKR